VLYLTWTDTNLPNFIKIADYNKYIDKAELIDHCFYVDSKNPEKKEVQNSGDHG
jgi:hypothetical protein